MATPATLVPPAAASRHLRLPLLQVNWALLVGAALVLGIVYLAWAGPGLAPHDPMKENFILRIGDKWVPAPFAPLAVPGFPLGSDERGRDILSLLLWAVRPTLTMVGLVAALRLTLGVTLGLAAGWFAGRAGRLLDGLIAAALTAPVLIVALAVLAVLGVEPGSGLRAFVVGLSLTGWAETARVVREQTRALKGQPYIEAARALGGSEAYLLARHGLPHVLPLVWVVAAFEVSSTLLAIASLGFLGYYTNEAWVMVTDTTAERVAGMPDLGQMLSTVTSDIFTGPWKMFAAGSLVFLVVLGFNLLGAGLRLQLNVERVKRRTWLTVGRERTQDWYEARLRPWLETRAGRLAAGGLMLALVAVAAGWGATRWQAREAAMAPPALAELTVPGGHLWASERHDPYGTLWADVTGPRGRVSVGWTYENPAGLGGGPAVDAEGRIFIPTLDPALVALDEGGNVRWQTPLPAEPVGTPALGAEGQVYVADVTGGLTALTPEGAVAWHMEPTGAGEATAGPVVGPDGSIYYTIGGWVQAVSADGRPLWRVAAVAQRASASPRLSPDRKLVFLKGTPLIPETGEKIVYELDRIPDFFFVGANGRLYLRVDARVMEWTHDAGALTHTGTVDWDPAGIAWGNMADGGVTGDSWLWVVYSSNWEDARFGLIQPNGQTADSWHFAMRPARAIGVDRDNVGYLCGPTWVNGGGLRCLAFEAGKDEPAWDLILPGGTTVTGGALVEGALYVATREGSLHALKEYSP